MLLIRILNALLITIIKLYVTWIKDQTVSIPYLILVIADVYCLDVVSFVWDQILFAWNLWFWTWVYTQNVSVHLQMCALQPILYLIKRCVQLIISTQFFTRRHINVKQMNKLPWQFVPQTIETYISIISLHKNK